MSPTPLLSGVAGGVRCGCRGRLAGSESGIRSPAPATGSAAVDAAAQPEKHSRRRSKQPNRFEIPVIAAVA